VNKALTSWKDWLLALWNMAYAIKVTVIPALFYFELIDSASSRFAREIGGFAIVLCAGIFVTNIGALAGNTNMRVQVPRVMAIFAFFLALRSLDYIYSFWQAGSNFIGLPNYIWINIIEGPAWILFAAMNVHHFRRNSHLEPVWR